MEPGYKCITSARLFVLLTLLLSCVSPAFQVDVPAKA